MNKSLRDHLLARHAAAPRLDELRRAALPPADVTWGGFLRELFRPHRAAWRALAVVWLVLLVLQFTVVNSARPPVLAGPGPSPEAVAAWFDQLNSNETLTQIAQIP
ncbi:MAG: hypothetical protein WCL04_04340 [Verrucomicrobiota bacterium]